MFAAKNFLFTSTGIIADYLIVAGGGAGGHVAGGGPGREPPVADAARNRKERHSPRVRRPAGVLEGREEAVSAEAALRGDLGLLTIGHLPQISQPFAQGRVRTRLRMCRNHADDFAHCELASRFANDLPHRIFIARFLVFV